MVLTVSFTSRISRDGVRSSCYFLERIGVYFPSVVDALGLGLERSGTMDPEVPGSNPGPGPTTLQDQSIIIDSPSGIF